jgi:hypothetical protein
MKRYLHLKLPLNTHRQRVTAKRAEPTRNVSEAWRTPDGVEIWRADTLYQDCVEVREMERPLRVVLLEDYEALRRLYLGTIDFLNTPQGPSANSAPLSESVRQEPGIIG